MTVLRADDVAQLVHLLVPAAYPAMLDPACSQRQVAADLRRFHRGALSRRRPLLLLQPPGAREARSHLAFRLLPSRDGVQLAVCQRRAGGHWQPSREGAISWLELASYTQALALALRQGAATVSEAA